jgi:hypothetical protein
MNPEKSIVNLWLQRQGFFTIADVNAKNRVIDLIAIKQKKGEVEVRHVEVSCSITLQAITKERDKAEILRKFDDPNVIKTVKDCIANYIGAEKPYQKMLVTTTKINLPNICVVPFEDVIHEFVADLDTQNYRDPIVRTLQLFKYTLLSNPEKTASLITSEGEHKSLTSSSREKLTRALLLENNIIKSLGKKSGEELVVEMLKHSTLKQPERLAKALEGILTKRTATRFLNVLMQQKDMKTAVKEELKKEIKKDASLQEYFK